MVYLEILMKITDWLVSPPHKLSFHVQMTWLMPLRSMYQHMGDWTFVSPVPVLGIR